MSDLQALKLKLKAIKEEEKALLKQISDAESKHKKDVNDFKKAYKSQPNLHHTLIIFIHKMEIGEVNQSIECFEDWFGDATPENINNIFDYLIAVGRSNERVRNMLLMDARLPSKSKS